MLRKVVVSNVSDWVIRNRAGNFEWSSRRRSQQRNRTLAYLNFAASPTAGRFRLAVYVERGSRREAAAWIDQRHDDRWIGDKASEKLVINSDTANQAEGATTKAERHDARQRDEIAVGRVNRHEGNVAFQVSQGSDELRVDTPVLIPEMSGADNLAVAVLNLKHREASELHGRAGIVAHVVHFWFDAGDRPQTEVEVVQECDLQRGETNVNPGIFALERFADGRVCRLEPDSIILR